MERESAYKKILDAFLGAFFLCRTDRVERCCGCMDIEVVVTVNTCYLLDDISLHRNVLGSSPAGNFNGEYIVVYRYAETERTESVHDSIIVYLDTGIAVNESLCEVEADLRIVESIFIGER